MKLVSVSEAFAVSPQIQAEDMREVTNAGYRTVICNRPDGEEPGQPAVALIQEAAEAAGLGFRQGPRTG